MAKRDPAFNFYDADAARDMSHMTRLERGGYIDVILAQKKFGRMPINILKKILGKDFDECWEAIVMIMETQPLENDNPNETQPLLYFIPWVEDSIIERGKFLKKQSGNGSLGGRPSLKEPKINPNETHSLPNINNGLNQKKPLEIAIEIEIENSLKKEKGEEFQLPVEEILVPVLISIYDKKFSSRFVDVENDYPAVWMLAQKIGRHEKVDFDTDREKFMITAKSRWSELVDFISTNPWFAKLSLDRLNKDFANLIQSFNANKIPKLNAIHSTSNPKVTANVNYANAI